jgi:protein TonB
MKPSVDNVTSNQPKTLRKRDAKKSVMRKTQGVLYFQVGLILSLIAILFAMEIQVGTVSRIPLKQGITLEEPVMKRYVIEKQNTYKPIAKIKSKRPTVVPAIIKDVINVVDTDKQIKDVAIATEVAPIETPVVETPIVPAPPVSIPTRNVNNVEFVPVFPGCESLGSNEEKRACLSSKIGAFISRKFKTDAFENLEKNKTHNIYVQFTIDENGNVTDVKARATDIQMQKEGMRVIRKLPKIKPGRMGDVNVPVLYMVPISFKVE